MPQRAQYEWSPLGYRSDPIPGNPGELESHAALYRSNAENLGRAITNLRNLRNDEETCSVTVAKIMEKAGAVADTLEQVKGRYDTVARALAYYAPILRTSQATSVTALNQATDAARRVNQARSAANEAYLRSLHVEQGVRDQAAYDFNQSVSSLKGAQADIASAKAQLAKAIADRNSAGDNAAATISATVNDSPLNDTVGDHLSALGHKIWKAVVIAATWIWDNLDTIALVVDAICLVLTLTGVAAPLAIAIKAAAWAAKAAKVAKVLSYAKYAKQGINVVVGLVKGINTGDWREFQAEGAKLATTLVTKTVFKLGGAALRGSMDKGIKAVNDVVFRDADQKFGRMIHAGRTAAETVAGQNGWWQATTVTRLTDSDTMQYFMGKGLNLAASWMPNAAKRAVENSVGVCR